MNLFLKSKFVLSIVFLFCISFSYAGDFLVTTKTNWGGLGSNQTFITSDNFVVTYEHGQSTRAQAIDITRALEKSYDVLAKKHKFKTPDYRVFAYLKKKLDPKDWAAGYAYRPRYAGLKHAYMEIKTGMREGFTKVVAAHEFFHIIEFMYDAYEPSWMLESNAQVIEDTVVPEEGGFLANSHEWYKKWNKGETLTSVEDLFEYGTSIFFQFLKERFDGMAFINRLWVNAAKEGGDNSLSAIVETISDRSKFDKIFGDFSIALHVKEKVPGYSFKKGDKIFPNIKPTMFNRGTHYYSKFNRRTGGIESGSEEKVKPLTAKYYQIPVDIEALSKPNLYIYVLTRSGTPLQVRAATENGADDKKEVFTAKLESNGRASVITIPEFGGDKKAVLFSIANPSFNNTEKYRLKFVMGDPPYLKEIRVSHKKTGKLLYHAKWKTFKVEGRDQRDLFIVKSDPLEVDDEKFPELLVKLKFSNSLKTDPRVSIGEGSAVVDKRLFANRQEWEGTIRPSILSEEEKELKIKIDAIDYKRDRLDTNPYSVPALDHMANYWLRYEGGEGGGAGGPDQNHKLKLTRKGAKSIAILIDGSGSMKELGRMPKAKRSATDTIEGMSKKDEATVWTFTDCGSVGMRQGFSSNKDQLVSAVNGIGPSSGTPLAMGIRNAGNYLNSQGKNVDKILVVLSDGAESCDGDPAAEANAIASHGLSVRYSGIFTKGDKETEDGEEEPEVKEDPPRNDPPPPPPEEEKKEEDNAPCDVQTWKSYQAKKENKKMRYYITSYRSRKIKNNCFVWVKSDMHKIYYGKLEGTPPVVSWGVNSTASSSETEKADYKSNKQEFEKIVSKYRSWRKDGQKEAFQAIERFVQEEMKK